jgi:SPP1 family predicted phage head-tail adaptor
MRAGLLRRRVQVQRRVSSTDAEGSPQESWTTIRSAWAAVAALTAQERLLAAQAGVQVTHSVTMRYAADLVVPTAHDLRLVEGARVLEVTSEPVDIQERHRELRLQCRELLPS